MRIAICGLTLALALPGWAGAAQTVPACVTRALSGEVGAPSSVPAPRITPDRGDAGTTLRIEGEGFPVGSDVTVVALYGEGDCSIVGLGDQLLGATRVDPDGTYRMERPWPSVFAPMLGRGSFPTTPLPDGRYWIVAIACSQPAECSLTEASAPGGPFHHGVAPRVDPSPAAQGPGTSEPGIPVGSVAGAGAGAVVILSGLLLLRRMLR